MMFGHDSRAFEEVTRLGEEVRDAGLQSVSKPMSGRTALRGARGSFRPALPDSTALGLQRQDRGGATRTPGLRPEGGSGGRALQRLPPLRRLYAREAGALAHTVNSPPEAETPPGRPIP